MKCKELISKFLTFDICENSLQVEDDGNVMVLTAKVVDYNPTPNKWGLTREVVEKHMNTIVGKHIVTKYFEDTDTLGGHEDNKQVYRLGEDIIIPHKDTNAIGTVIDVWCNDEGMFVKCTLMILEHMNECSLIQEWLDKGIKVNLSVEWFYTESIIIDDIEWIVDPVFSNICVLNSESKNGKPIVRGNYDVAELGINLLDEMNNAIIEDLKLKNNKKGDDKMNKNRFLEALNGLSLNQTWDAIYDALNKVLTADEYWDVWLYDVYAEDGYFLTRTWGDDADVYKKYEYTTTEDGVVEIVGEVITVKRSDLFTPVAVANEQLEEVKAQLEAVNAELEGANGLVEELHAKVGTIETANEELVTVKATLEEKLNELVEYKVEKEKAEFETKLNAKIDFYEAQFNQIGQLDKFNEDETQLKIKETLNSDELTALKAENEINNYLLSQKTVSNEKSPLLNQALNSNMNNLLPVDVKARRLQEFGF